MRKLAALLLLAASCADAPKVSDGARKAFEAWAKAASSGDAEKTLAGLSEAYKSSWLYERLNANDPIARKWRGELTGAPRTALDLWWGQAIKHGSGREEPLNGTVLEHPSFIKMFRDYFVLEAKMIQTGLSRAEVTEAYGDGTGVTVLVRSGPQMPVEYYQMVYEGTEWKIDLYRRPQPAGK